jgi:zinc transporter ZupT
LILGLTTYDAKDPDTKYPPIEPLRPPEGAPNVLLVLLDDVGFGASSAFGGPCNTPTFEKLAAGGLKYNRFHTTALCAPTRQALLTGRNHHSVGMGNITETATAATGQNSLRSNTKAPLALTLKLNGYSTAIFDKCHEVPVWENNPMGPFEHWPSGADGSGMGILLGSLLDGVPESLMLGLSLVHSPQVSLAFIFAVAISNIPQGLGGTAGMLASGWAKAKITRLWLAVCGLSILAAALGYWLATMIPGANGAVVDAFAAGALLVMLTDSMIPESFEHGGRETGLFLVIGFSLAVAMALGQMAS